MLTAALIREGVDRALAEDAPWGDLTATHVLPESATAVARLVPREPGVLSGGAVFAEAFARVNPHAGSADGPAIEVRLALEDGMAFSRGDVLATVAGPARAVLTAERVALNFVQRMSGIATLTARYVEAVAGTRARIVDTRKTTPGLRAFERHAVVSGGGRNHRFGLSDAVMLKDNHLAVLAAEGAALPDALRALRDRLGHMVRIEVEVDRLDQLPDVLAGGADVIMLDNFSLEDLRRGVELIGGRAIVEASGGVSLETVGAIAATGVDVISVGALTHSAAALDLGLDIELDRAGHPGRP